jgi:hypothetical protein
MWMSEAMTDGSQIVLFTASSTLAYKNNQKILEN